jgi:hypothetical protein
MTVAQAVVQAAGVRISIAPRTERRQTTVRVELPCATVAGEA